MQFPPSSIIEVSYIETEKPEEDNLALAHVFGDQHDYDWWHYNNGYPKIRTGDGFRYYEPYTVIATPPPIMEAKTYIYRQYLNMDS